MCYFDHHLIDEQTEAQQVTCPKTHTCVEDRVRIQTWVAQSWLSISRFVLFTIEESYMA